MADTVKIKLELGEVELSYEGPAAFAREDLMALVDGLVERLSAARIEGFGEFALVEDDGEDDDEEDAGAGDAAPDVRRGH